MRRENAKMCFFVIAGPESIDPPTLPSDGFSDAQLRIMARASHAPE
jgi:hypothetical protein